MTDMPNRPPMGPTALGFAPTGFETLPNPPLAAFEPSSGPAHEGFIKRNRVKVVAAVAGVALIATGLALKNNSEPASASIDNTKTPAAASRDMTPAEVAEACDDPSDTQKMIFNEKGRPQLGFEVGKKVTVRNVISAIQAGICNEIEGSKYFSSINPAAAFSGIEDPTSKTRKQLFTKMDEDEKFHDEVANNMLNLLSSAETDAASVDPEKLYVAIAFDAKGNTTFGTQLGIISRDIVVVSVNQAAGDGNWDESLKKSRLIVIGSKDKNGNVVATDLTGTVFTDVENVDVGCEIRKVVQPEVDKDSPVDAPVGKEADGGSDDVSESSNNGGASSGSESKKGGKSDQEGDDCDDGCGKAHVDEECDDGCAPTPTTKKPRKPRKPTVTIPATSTPPATTTPRTTTTNPPATTIPAPTTTRKPSCPPGWIIGPNGLCKLPAPITTAPPAPSLRNPMLSGARVDLSVLNAGRTKVGGRI